MESEKPTILIVDDSAMTRHMIRRVIGMTDVPVDRILEAGDGRAALTILNSEKIDLVLADLNMPVMDGFEMIRRMQESATLKAIAVVVISAQPDADHIVKLEEAGVAGYLPKPFTPEAVRDLIQPLLEAARKPEPPTPQLKPDSSFNMNLAESLAEALETMAFISPELPEDSDEYANEGETRVVHVAFHGAGGNGCLTLQAPKEFGVMVAANCSTDPTDAAGDDALKELANVTCGLLLRKRVGGAKGFEMQPPVVGPDTDNETDWSEDVIRFKADGHQLVAKVASDWPLVEHSEAQ